MKQQARAAFLEDRKGRKMLKQPSSEECVKCLKYC